MKQTEVIRNLIANGWIPLRQLGVLLNKPDRSIYGRQVTRNPVPTVRIGGTQRVYTDAVIEEIKRAKSLEPGEAEVLLSILKTGLKDKERKEGTHA